MTRSSRVIAALASLVAATAVAAPAQAAPVGGLGSGHHPGVALDDGGTAYVAWKAEIPGPQSEATVVDLCTVAPRARTCSAPPVRVPFPLEGFYEGEVTVLLPEPGVVEVLVGRNGGLDYGTYLARSVDGGRTFAPGIKVADTSAQAAGFAARLPDGRLAAGCGDNRSFGASVTAADGSQGAIEPTQLGGNGFSTDTAVSGQDVFTLGGFRTTEAFRLPAGADSFVPGAWRPYPLLPGGRGRVDGGPAGAVALLESSFTAAGRLYSVRLEPDGLGPAVTLARGGGFQSTEIDQQRDGRLTALWAVEDELRLARSEDGGGTWSSGIDVAGLSDDSLDLTADVTPSNAGAAVFAEATGDPAPIRFARFDAGGAPQATVTVGDARVQVRSNCVRGRRVALGVRATRGSRAVSVASVIGSARFGLRQGRITRRARYSARATLRRSSSRPTVTVRLEPRRGAAVRARFRAAGCSSRL